MGDGLRFDPEASGDDELSRAELRATPTRSGDPAGPTRVIVKVTRPGYVPDGFTVRSRVDDVLFTAEARPDAIRAAMDDPAVESIAHPRRLHRADDDDDPE
jgi:hypothetical protein